MLAIGCRVGSHEILSVVGAGAMGQVYRARDARLSRDVAIRVLPAALAADSSRVRRRRNSLGDTSQGASSYQFERTSVEVAASTVMGGMRSTRSSAGLVPAERDGKPLKIPFPACSLLARPQA